MTSTPFTMRLLPDDLAILDAACARLGVSRAAVVRSLIHRHAGKLMVAEASVNDPTKTGRRRRKSVEPKGKGRKG